MTDQDRQDRQNRNARSQGFESPRQPQQWHDTQSQPGSWGREGSSSSGYHTYQRDRDQSDDYRQVTQADPDDRTAYRHADGDRRNSREAYGAYDRHSYDPGSDRFRSFTSEDYGGRDFAARGASIAGGLAPSDSYRPSYGPGSWGSSSRDSGVSGRNDYSDWRSYGEQRGFLARAGDEIASWFGDRDAARRREQDEAASHRGRGPSNYTRSDERIREDANDALTHDHRVDASNITVTVANGEVTLDGTVDSRQSKRQAEDVVDTISGVRHVQNNLRVSSDRSAIGSTAGTSGLGYTSNAIKAPDKTN